MEIWKEVRRQVLTNELSQRAAPRKYGLGWHTLKKILAHAESPGYRQRQPRKKRILEAFLPVIEEILTADQQAPKKPRHTARQFFERLQGEDGYRGGLTRVQDAVCKWRQYPTSTSCIRTATTSTTTARATSIRTRSGRGSSPTRCRRGSNR